MERDVEDRRGYNRCAVENGWVRRTQGSFRRCAYSENNRWAVALNIYDVRGGEAQR
jgi:hypothetical protein